MDSVYSSWLYILIFIYIICIYYSEIDEPNSYIDKNNGIVSGIKWFSLILLIIVELSMAYALDNSKDNSEPQNIKILFAVIFTWFLLFTPTIYLYYSGKQTNGFYGKSSIYINSIFENIIGYLFVKNEANQIFADLDIGNIQEGQIKDMEKIMIEINKSRAIFINQLNIFNFKNIWDKLFSPLFSELQSNTQVSQGIPILESKEELQEKLVTQNGGSLYEIRDKLFNLVKRKYIIGKCLWFLYNCIMCLSISLYLVII